MLRTIGILGACAAAALTATAAATSPWVPDPGAHNRYSGELRHVQAIDARLNEHVVISRSGLSMSYDPLSRDVAELRRALDSLTAIPTFLDRESRAELSLRLATLTLLASVKAERVEAFKMENAVLRNSVRFFPVAATELSELAEKKEEQRALAACVRGLVRDVLLLNLLPEKEMTPRVERAIDTLATWPASGAERADLMLLLSHARVVLDRKPRVDAITADILALPALSSAEALEAAYQRRYRAALDRSGTLRSFVFVLALLTLGLGAAYVTARLRRSISREKELRQMKSHFVSVASHEFRTPLSVILSSAELLESYGVKWPEEKRRDHLGRIMAAVKGMTHLLDGVLAIGRLDTDKATFDPRPIDVELFCADCASAVVRSDGGGRRVELSFRGVTGQLCLDERLLRHVLSNLLSNALKYSPEGAHVVLDVAHAESWLTLDIRDSGIGIPEGDQRALFESFHRGSNVGIIAGSGLGMAIVKRALDMHGGTIAVTSRVGSGTRVVVRVPLAKERP